MSQQQILKILSGILSGSSYGREILEIIENAMKRDPSLDLNALLYWLNEKAYYLMAWQNRHLMEGQDQKAQIESEKNKLIQECIEALKKAQVQA